MEQGARREKLHSLQALRAVAAIAVLVFHVCNNAALGLDFHPLVLRALKVGADAAVDLFFVLSGFIMVYTQQRAQRGGVEFARQRIARIVPLYWVTTLGFMLFVLVAEPSGSGISGAVAQASAAKNYLASSMMFISHLFGYRFPVVLPGWSLEYEMLFYAVFAGAILVSKRHTVAIAVTVLAVLCIDGLLRPLCIEFAAGALVAQAWFANRHRQIAAVMVLIAPALVAIGLAEGFYWQVDDNDWLRIAFCGMPMLAVFLVALCVTQRRRPVLGMLGDCSYAIYVSHCGWLALFIHVALPVVKPGGSALVLASGIAWCLAGGIAMHFLVEKKFDALLRRRGKARAAVAEPGVLAV